MLVHVVDGRLIACFSRLSDHVAILALGTIQVAAVEQAFLQVARYLAARRS